MNSKTKKAVHKQTPSSIPSALNLPQFPAAWPWFIDEVIPQWVKKQYSPRESWKNKPFSDEDARFFFKGIEDLSQLFTEERPKGLPPYFQHPKYRSSYLLYFLPLQMAKFLTLFHLHSEAIEAALEQSAPSGVLKIADLGAGPGTASLGLLLFLLNRKTDPKHPLPLIELSWFDTNKDIMSDGEALVAHIASHFPKLRDKVRIKSHVLPWWKAHSHLDDDISLAILGHVLNESSAPQRDSDPFWQKLIQKTKGGGILMIEPAAKGSAQTLSRYRDHFFESGWIDKDPTRIWGPCIHAGACPLSEGRDWCHFSFPTQIPGQWFRRFSEGLGSERHWVKLSYLWLASAQYPSPKMGSRIRRVISDPLEQGPKASVLICEPESAGRYPLKAGSRTRRGDLITL